MPTGYTAFIEDGRIKTGKEFLTLCLRAFGIACHMKEESLDVPCPRRFEYDGSCDWNIGYAEKHLEDVEEMSFDQVKQLLIKQHEDKIQCAQKKLPEYLEKQKLYAKIKAEVEAWNPPTEEHQGIKKFALNQIEISSCDHMIEYYTNVLNSKIDLSDEKITQWKDEMVTSARQSVRLARQKKADTLKSIEKSNIFLDFFFKSLEQIDI